MKTAVLCVFLLTILTFPALTASPTAKPEEVGLSSERLQRINQMIERRIAAGDIAGAVTIVARKGKVVHHAAQGVMDLQSKQSMSSASMFRIASMTKPVVGVAIMMLVEEGKVHLNDPVSRYIPQFRDMKVAVAQPAPGAAGGRAGGEGNAGPQVLHGSGPARDHDQGSPDARLGPGQRTDGQQRHREGRAQGWGDALGLHSAPRIDRRWNSSRDRAGPIARARDSKRSAASSRSHRARKLDQFFRTRIFDPLGMKDITFWPTDAQMPRVATVYGARTERPDQDTDAERHDVAGTCTSAGPAGSTAPPRTTSRSG